LASLSRLLEDEFHLISACFAGLLEVRVEAGMAVATAVLLANLGQLLHPGPSCNTTHHTSPSQPLTVL